MIELNLVYEDNFYEIIKLQIANNPDAINFQDAHQREDSYISLAAYLGSIDKVSYLLENKANIYLLNKDKENALHEAIVGCEVAIRGKKDERLKNCFQIFKILLNYEAEQRAYFPEQYINTPAMKEKKNNNNFTPIELAERTDFPSKKELITKLKKALEEAEIYYQKCLQNKANNIPMEPYHKQFLPEINNEETVKESIAENVEVKWSDKNSANSSIYQRRRSKSAEEITNEKENSMKLRSRSGEIESKPLLSDPQSVNKKESWAEWFSKLVMSDNGRNKNEKNL